MKKNAILLLSTTLLLLLTLGCSNNTSNHQENTNTSAKDTSSLLIDDNSSQIENNQTTKILYLISKANETKNYTIDVEILETNQTAISMVTLTEREGNYIHIIAPTWYPNDNTQPTVITEGYYEIKNENSVILYSKYGDQDWQKQERDYSSNLEYSVEDSFNVFSSIPCSKNIIEAITEAPFLDGFYHFEDMTYDSGYNGLLVYCKDIKVSSTKNSVSFILRVSGQNNPDTYMVQKYTLSKIGETIVSVPKEITSLQNETLKGAEINIKNSAKK